VRRSDRIVIGGLLVFITTCCADDSGAPTDASATRDAGHDAGRDATTRDAALLDAGPADAGPIDPGWRRMPGIPTGCDVQLAENAELATGVFRFEACPARATGCRQLVVDWPLRPYPIHSLFPFWRGDYDEGHGYVVFWRHASDPVFVDGIVLRDDGAAAVAVRFLQATDTNRACAAPMPAVGGGKYAIILTERALTPDEVGPTHVYGGDLADPVGTFHRVVTLGEAEFGSRLEALQYLRVGSERIAGFSNGQEVLSIGWDGSFTQLSEPPGDVSEPGPVVEDAVFYTTLGATRNSVHVAVGAAPARELVTPGDGVHAFMLETDGRDMVWMQGYEREGLLEFGRIEIWTSPFALDSSDLRPRYVAQKTRPVQDAFISAGYGFVGMTGEAGAEIYRLSDGMLWTASPPPDRTFGPIYYTGEDEFAIGVPRPMSTQTETIQYIRYDALP
jgi:hypothetical protein